MNFSEALLLMKRGKRVRRKSWIGEHGMIINPDYSCLYMYRGQIKGKVRNYANRSEVIKKLPKEYKDANDWEECV